MQDDTRCNCLEWTTDPEQDRFVGEHYGYERLPNGVTHQRRVEWKKTKRIFEIEDKLIGFREGVPILPVESGFNLHPECVIREIQAGSVTITRDPVKLTLEADQGAWSTRPYFYAPEYGIKQYGQRLVLTWEPGRTASCLVLRQTS